MPTSMAFTKPKPSVLSGLGWAGLGEGVGEASVHERRAAVCMAGWLAGWLLLMSAESILQKIIPYLTLPYTSFVQIHV